MVRHDHKGAQVDPFVFRRAGLRRDVAGNVDVFVNFFPERGLEVGVGRVGLGFDSDAPEHELPAQAHHEFRFARGEVVRLAGIGGEVEKFFRSGVVVLNEFPVAGADCASSYCSA